MFEELTYVVDLFVTQIKQFPLSDLLRVSIPTLLGPDGSALVGIHILINDLGPFPLDILALGTGHGFETLDRRLKP